MFWLLLDYLYANDIQNLQLIIDLAKQSTQKSITDQAVDYGNYCQAGTTLHFRTRFNCIINTDRFLSLNLHSAFQDLISLEL
jgi:hypothetical protein